MMSVFNLIDNYNDKDDLSLEFRNNEIYIYTLSDSLSSKLKGKCNLIKTYKDTNYFDMGIQTLYIQMFQRRFYKLY